MASKKALTKAERESRVAVATARKLNSEAMLNYARLLFPVFAIAGYCLTRNPWFFTAVAGLGVKIGS